MHAELQMQWNTDVLDMDDLNPLKTLVNNMHRLSTPSSDALGSIHLHETENFWRVACTDVRDLHLTALMFAAWIKGNLTSRLALQQQTCTAIFPVVGELHYLQKLLGSLLPVLSRATGMAPHNLRVPLIGKAIVNHKVGEFGIRFHLGRTLNNSDTMMELELALTSEVIRPQQFDLYRATQVLKDVGDLVTEQNIRYGFDEQLD